jgi:hypothetical protein
MEIVDNLRVGKPQTTPSQPAHTPGVRRGNKLGSYERQEGHLPDGRATARRSTSINPHLRDPIDPRSPMLSPA